MKNKTLQTLFFTVMIFILIFNFAIPIIFLFDYGFVKWLIIWNSINAFIIVFAIVWSKNDILSGKNKRNKHD